MSTPIRLNLLPHREQKRIARQRQFVSLAVMLGILGIAIVGLGHIVLASQIEQQKSRNSLLKTEIAKLDEQIKEIDKLRDQIQQVISRKQVVETLQANRNEAVHLLDQLVRQLPDGVYLRSIKQSGTRVAINGYAQSNARVSTLMRNIESSPWVTRPELVEIKLVPVPGTKAPDGPKISEFTLNMQVKRETPPPPPPGTAPAKPGAAPAKPGAAPAAAPAPAPAKPAPGAAAAAAKA
jgi:type IV pilus assembly protein PilN